MDRVLARKLNSDDGKELHDKLLTLAKQYLEMGQKTVDFYAADFDVSHDLFQCYAQLSRKDLENMSNGHPRRYILPMITTQVTTMATFISQALFGTDQPNKVEPRSPGQEVTAEIMNQLLRWNAERQSMFLTGFMWVTDCLLYNRGVFYESWEPIIKNKIVPKEVEDPDEKDDEGNPKKYTKFVRELENEGGFVKFHIVSPYDFICDPGLPLYRLQEMRFVGHRSKIPWVELKRRSELEVDDPAYVLEKSVEDLKEEKKGAPVGSTPGPSGSGAGTTQAALLSRTSYERSRPTAPTGNDTANKEDGGIVSVYELHVKLVPKDNELGDETDVRKWKFLLGNQRKVLAVEEEILEHNDFPYSVGEGRPSPHYQYTPSWVLMLKPLQDYADFLKNRRQEAASNTVGNIFIVKSDKVNIDDFMDPDKETKFIEVKPEAGDVDLNSVVKQVPIQDVTRDFSNEIQRFVAFANDLSGANSQIQGNPDDASATAVAGAQQMAMGRLAAVARCLSSEALVPQTRRTVSNFQQFFDAKMYLRIKGSSFDLPKELLATEGVDVTKDAIQGEFDYIPHDGSLPTTDTKKVAAMTRILDAAPAFPFMFDPNVPGNFDLRKIFATVSKAAGVPIENFVIKTPSAAGGPPAPGAPPPAAPAPGGAPPSVPVSPGQPRQDEVGGGLKLPAVDINNITPDVRPANV